MIKKNKKTGKYYARCDNCGYDFRALKKVKQELINELVWWDWQTDGDNCICKDCAEISGVVSDMGIYLDKFEMESKKIQRNEWAQSEEEKKANR